MKKYSINIVLIALLLLASCELNVESSNKQTIGNVFSTETGVSIATDGSYALLKDVLEFRGVENRNNTYVRHLYQLSEFAGDNVMYTQFSSDPLYLVFTRNHVVSQENTSYFWFLAYKIILGTNLVIENAEVGVNSDTDQLVGENYFLRAMAQFDLLKFYAFPYTHGIENPGIIIKTNATSPQEQARATVGESYEQVISDLLKGAELMGASRGKEYASKEAAWALLSRVYLYMEENDLAVEFADKVINSSKFSLAARAVYIDNFANTPQSNESIFVVKHIAPQDDWGKNGSIGSMYYNDGNNGGWGEVFVSQTFLDLIQQHPEDVRNDLIQITGNSKNGFPIRYILKFSGQNGIVNLSSPQYLRLSEMYLNRAEAKAKLSMDADAIADVNIIRSRAGLSGTALYDISDLGGRSVLDVVLEERRLELAYEGHRSFDQFRNKRDMNRTYEGIHLVPGASTQLISWDDKRNIFFIPDEELNTNPACVQNE